ncbi:hypothetical protein D3C77_552190 [compost metagenome]
MIRATSMASNAPWKSRPSNSPELISWPYSPQAASHSAATSSPRLVRTTALNGRLYFLANSKSRSSWAGTAITAPSP